MSVTTRLPYTKQNLKEKSIFCDITFGVAAVLVLVFWEKTILNFKAMYYLIYSRGLRIP